MPTETVPDAAAGSTCGLRRRELRVLVAIVDLYVRTGEAVASHLVARRLGRELSPASVRSVMASLEAAGMLSRPHTSAGCVPTDAGFRLYVNSLGRNWSLPASTRRRLSERMAAAKRELVEGIEWLAGVVAEETHEAGVAVRPIGEEPTLEAVSLMPLGEGRALGVIITADGSVEKRLLNLSAEWNAEELLEVANYVNATFRGKSLEAAHKHFEQGTAALPEIGRPAPGRTAEEVIELGRRLLAGDGEDAEVQVAGADNLLQATDFADVDRIRSLLTLLSDRTRILRLWRRGFDRGRTQIIIGRESDVTATGSLGTVATLFFREGRRVGAVGVVGPLRMDYGRVVPVVEFIGATLTGMLEEGGARNE